LSFNQLFDYLLSEPLALIILLIFLFYLFTFIEYFFGNRSIRNLKDIPAQTPDNPISVSIVIPARNEERKIRQALTSVLALDYPDYEVIVINDRSDDNTGRILDDLSHSNAKLKVIHLESLPPGWLGKNYALDCGVKKANGDYIIFSDADVVFRYDTLSRVMPYVKENNIDHLSMAPSHVFKKFLLTSVVIVFEFLFMMRFKPWKVSNPKSRFFIGIGSFNMIRLSAYKKTGGFETLRMRPDDDIMLGKLVKKHGLKSDFIYAPEQISLEWYYSLREMIRAFYKNTYAGFNYNFLNAIFSIVMLFILTVLPYFSLFFLSGIGLIVNIGVLFVIFCIYLVLAGSNKVSIFYFFTYPLACVIIVYLMLRAIFLTLTKGGIDWRGTFYSLKELKSNKI
jgi:cellulose synthase/poly-beta-1,6-N-acetylglucosamine synthase-like glycosyltransferase